MATDGPLAGTSRVLGAVSLAVVGAIHLQQYAERYSAIPVIGTLFMLSFVGASMTSLALLLPLTLVAGHRAGAVTVILAVVGIGQAATQFVFLAISERMPLFGFQEPGYDPTAILATRVSEVATVVFLSAFLVARR